MTSLDSGLLRLPAREQAALIARREISPVELCRATLERIDRLDPELGAFMPDSGEKTVEGVGNPCDHEDAKKSEKENDNRFIL